MTPWELHGSGVCAVNAWVTKDLLGLAFQPCDGDCSGAAITDAMLAVHGLLTTWRLFRRHASRNRAGESSSAHHPDFLWLAACHSLCNASWSLVGWSYWWQPGGERSAWFDSLWRLNAYVQAALFFFAWRLLLEVLRLAHLGGPRLRGGGLLRFVSVAHPLCFALLTSRLLPERYFGAHCTIDHYVLWGASNITPPLGLMWAVLTATACRYGLWRQPFAPADTERVGSPTSVIRGRAARTGRGGRGGEWRYGEFSWCGLHPVLLGALSGIPIWAGNSAVVFGRHTGFALWSRTLVSYASQLTGGGALAPEAFDEMATFHFFGMLGFELLFRCYDWIGEHQKVGERRAVQAYPVQVVSCPGGGDLPPSAWLAMRLVREKHDAKSGHSKTQ